MQNSIAKGALALATSTPLKNSSKKTLHVDDKSSSKDSPKNFISILFEHIKNSSKTSITKIDNTSSKSQKIKKLKTPSALEHKAKSSSELLLNEMLYIINLTKDGNNTQVKFPKFSDKLQTILNKSTTLNDFKNVRNMDELIKVAKKYNLGLQNINLSKEKIADLQKDFPKLDLKQFFKPSKLEQNKPLSIKTADHSLENHNNKNVGMPIKQAAKILNHNSAHNIVKNKIAPTLVQNVQSVDEKTIYTAGTTTKSFSNSAQNRQNIAKIDEEAPKAKATVTKDILQTLLTKVSETIKKTDVQNVPEKIKSNERVQKIANVKSKKVKIVQISPKSTQKESIDESEVPKVTKNKKSTVHVVHHKKTILKYAKIAKNDTEHVTPQTKITLSSLLNQHVKKDIQVETPNISLNNIIQQPIDSLHEKQNKKSTSRNNDSLLAINQKPDIRNHLIQNGTKIQSNLTNQDSLNQFATDLKEKIDNYKPPIMKLQLSLNPKNLGEVGVTLLHRGNNLHVNITSNTNAMFLFTQNQAEFKNSLVNMGFTNLEMNFSNQKQSKENQQKKGNKQRSTGTLEGTSNQTNYGNTVDLIIPQYV